MTKRRTEISSFSPLNDFVREAEDFIKHARNCAVVQTTPSLRKRVDSLSAALRYLTQKKHLTTKRDYQRAVDRHERNSDHEVIIDLYGLRDETEFDGAWVSAFVYLPPTPAKRKSLNKGFKL
jgi:hypothetical protein